MTSPNKGRIMKLALELERTVRMQAIDYPVLEGLLKELLKIAEHKREHDVVIMRAGRVMGSLVFVVRRLPSLHRTEAHQSMLAIELSKR